MDSEINLDLEFSMPDNCETIHPAIDCHIYLHGEVTRQNQRLDEMANQVATLGKDHERLRIALVHEEETLDRMEKGISEMLTVFESWRGAMRVLEMIGKVAKPLGAIAGLISAVMIGYYAFKNGGPK